MPREDRLHWPDSEDRAHELSSATGVPIAFKVAWAWPVSDWQAVEALTHGKLGACRPNLNREFFSCSVATARREVRRTARAYLRPAWLRLLVGPSRLRVAATVRPRWSRPTSNLVGPMLVMALLVAGIAQYKPAPPRWLPKSVRVTIGLLETLHITVSP